MDDDEYELLPRKELEKMRHEFENSKVKPAQADVESIQQLTEAIRELTDLFKEAAFEMRREPDTNREAAVKYDVMIDQNRKIAAGILALADLMKKHLPEISRNTAESSRRLMERRVVRTISQQPMQQRQGQQVPLPPRNERMPPFPGNF